jgi:transcriptional regulator with XRE-family HTH domain
MELAHRLRIELALHNVRPTTVARRAGLHLSHLSRILNGHSRPTPEVLRRIEAAIRAESDSAPSDAVRGRR